MRLELEIDGGIWGTCGEGRRRTICLPSLAPQVLVLGARARCSFRALLLKANNGCDVLSVSIDRHKTIASQITGAFFQAGRRIDVSLIEAAEDFKVWGSQLKRFGSGYHGKLHTFHCYASLAANKATGTCRRQVS